MDLYIHSPICFHGVVLNYLRTGQLYLTSCICLFSVDDTDIEHLCMFMSRENVGQNLN
jgi:hypothetical protein